MKVRAEFYSRLKEIVGASSKDLELKNDSTIQDLLGALLSEHPKLRQLEKSLLFGIDVEFVDMGHAVKDGDVVAIMPPVQGG